MAAEGKKSKKKGNEDVDFDFNLGGFSFGKFFKGLENLIDLAEKFKEKGGFSETKEFTIPTGKEGKDLRGVFGFTVRTLASGEPHVESFGNIKKTPRGPVVEETREPIVDVFDEKDHVLVVAEVPGVEQQDVHFEVKGDILKLSADHTDPRLGRKYSKEILLPFFVNEKAESVVFKNGIFELKFLKLKEKK